MSENGALNLVTISFSMPFAENSSLMRSIDSPDIVTTRIERNGSFSGALKAGQGRESMKFRSLIFRVSSTSLKRGPPADHGGIVFERTH